MQESNPKETSGLFKHLKELGGTTPEEGLLQFPATLGSGYLRVFRPHPDMSIMMQHYELYRKLVLRRPKGQGNQSTVIFSFRNVLTDHITAMGAKKDRLTFSRLPSIRVSTLDMAHEIHIPPHFKTANIIIGIENSLLKALLGKSGAGKAIGQMLALEQSYLYEEVVSPKMQAVAIEIFEADPSADLSDFFYRLKAEELIYLFFTELLKRESMTRYTINQADITAIYRVRDVIMANLDVVPRLETLAQQANMSVSKLGKLFRQIFGESIYNYYQKLRMQQAAYLLREAHLSVSQAGYQLGFSNLSHFGRLFEKHMGLKPKQYSRKPE